MAFGFQPKEIYRVLRGGEAFRQMIFSRFLHGAKPILPGIVGTHGQAAVRADTV
jgi:hypothetical protein